MIVRPSALSRVFMLDPGAPFASLPMDPFRVVAADPGWQFADALPGASRGASKNYRTDPVQAICDMAKYGGSWIEIDGHRVHVADDAYLFLWRVSAMVEEAYRVVRAWGFIPKTEIVWRKLSSTGKKQHFGMGHHTRAAHETCILATRGSPKPLVRNIRSVFDAPTPPGMKGRAKHSAKPEFFYTDIVEKLAAGPYVELFARRQRRQWSCYGLEANK